MSDELNDIYKEIEEGGARDGSGEPEPRAELTDLDEFAKAAGLEGDPRAGEGIEETK